MRDGKLRIADIEALLLKVYEHAEPVNTFLAGVTPSVCPACQHGEATKTSYGLCCLKCGSIAYDGDVVIHPDQVLVSPDDLSRIDPDFAFTYDLRAGVLALGGVYEVRTDHGFGPHVKIYLGGEHDE